MSINKSIEQREIARWLNRACQPFIDTRYRRTLDKDSPATTVSARDNRSSTCSMRLTSVHACKFRTLFLKIAMNTLHISACNKRQKIIFRAFVSAIPEKFFETVFHHRYSDELFSWSQFLAAKLLQTDNFAATLLKLFCLLRLPWICFLPKTFWQIEKWFLSWKRKSIILKIEASTIPWNLYDSILANFEH